MQKKLIANHILVNEIEQLVNEGSHVTFVPKGSSMLPFIRGGRDSVVLKKDMDLSPLDIVLAKAGSTFVIHRVITIDGERLTLMGDGNICGTEQCNKTDVIAKVIKIIKEKKEIDCTGKSHLRAAALWTYLRPVRRYLLAIYRRIF